jgi:hypothetical protein
MATDSDSKLTKFESAVTVVTADFANSVFGGLYGSADASSIDADDPRVRGHVHDGEHGDGHGRKIHLVEHVEDMLTNPNLADDAVMKRNVWDTINVDDAIPEYRVDVDSGKTYYYLDLRAIRADFPFIEDEDPAGDSSENKLIRQRSQTFDGSSYEDIEDVWLTTEGFDFVFGSESLNDLDELDGRGNNRFQFDKSNASFRAGAADGDQWDESNRGSYTAAFGHNNTAIAGFSVISGGGGNTVEQFGLYATIAGGIYNSTDQIYSTVSGGWSNSITGSLTEWACAISGGAGNAISGSAYSVISGGFENLLEGNQTVISGGLKNENSSNNSVISGGEENKVTIHHSVVSGGQSNEVNEEHSVVSGGKLNKVSGQFSVISGGETNVASGNHSVVAGGGGPTDPDDSNVASGDNSTVSGGKGNSATEEYGSVSGGASNTASGFISTVSGGQGNVASNSGSTVSGGSLNTASGFLSAVSGGQYNTAEGDYSVVAGGGGNTTPDHINTASGLASVVSGGRKNSSEAAYTVVAGGYENTSNSIGASVSGGYGNTSEGDYSVVSGGENNHAYKEHSVVAGGKDNEVSNTGVFSNISGGAGCRIEGGYSTIAGGTGNLVQSDYSFIGSGFGNAIENSPHSVILGGGGVNPDYDIDNADGDGDTATGIDPGTGDTLTIGKDYWSNFLGAVVVGNTSVCSGIFSGRSNHINGSASNSGDLNFILGGKYNNIGGNEAVPQSCSIFGGSQNEILAAAGVGFPSPKPVIENSFIGHGGKNLIVIAQDSDDVYYSGVVCGYENAINAHDNTDISPWLKLASPTGFGVQSSYVLSGIGNVITSTTSASFSDTSLYSTIVSGSQNHILESWGSTILGGGTFIDDTGNNAPPYDMLSGYYSNIIAGSHHSTILNGSSNFIASYTRPFDGNLRTGSASNLVPSPRPFFSVACGRESYSYLYGQVSQAAGGFSAVKYASLGYPITGWAELSGWMSGEPSIPVGEFPNVMLGDSATPDEPKAPGSAQTFDLTAFGSWDYTLEEGKIWIPAAAPAITTFDFIASLDGDDDHSSSGRRFYPRYPGCYSFVIDGVLSFTEGQAGGNVHHAVSFTYKGFISTQFDGSVKYSGALVSTMSTAGGVPLAAVDPLGPGKAGSDFEISFTHDPSLGGAAPASATVTNLDQAVFSLYLLNNSGEPTDVIPGTGGTLLGGQGTGNRYVGESLVAKVQIAETLLTLIWGPAGP